MREVAAELERPVLLFSGGKDSIVLLRLAEKAFRPAPFPFPLMHVDTGHNFPEVIEFRDRRVAELGERLIVASVQESIDNGRVGRGDGPAGLAQPAADGDAARRDRRARLRRGLRRRAPRRGARAGEGADVLLPRRLRAVGPEEPAPGAVEPLQRAHQQGENVRVFPLSNWTELDVWEYIDQEQLEVPSIYFAHEREVFGRDGMLYAWREGTELIEGEQVTRETVRYRTVGDMSCTGGVRSQAATLEEVVTEIAATRITERGETRADDRVSEAAMEDRKKAGYF